MQLFIPERAHFGDPRKTTDDGLVAISDEMNTQILLEAYSHGIFPWPHGDYPTLWFSPEQRGCLLYTSPSPRDQRGSRMPSSA